MKGSADRGPVFDPAYTAAHYDTLSAGESARWERDSNMRLQKKVYKEHLRRRVTQGDHVLDAGCGPATFTTPLIDAGAKVTCLDLSEVQIREGRANESRADGYIRGSITDIPFKDGVFDVSLALGASLSYCFNRERTPSTSYDGSRVLAGQSDCRSPI